MNIKFLIIILFLLLSKISFAGTMTASGNTDDYCMSRGSAPDVFDGLVFRTPMNQGTGSSVRDVSGYGANGTITGATWVNVDGRRCLSFDGVDDYVYASATTLPLIGTSSLSASYWIRIVGSATGNHRILYYSNDTSNRLNFIYEVANSRFVAEILSGGTYYGGETTIVPVANTWYHFAFTFNKSTGSGSVYVNGLPRSATGFASGGTSVHNVLAIGANSTPAAYFKGWLDDVRIYNRALTGNEIERIYQATKK